MNTLKYKKYRRSGNGPGKLLSGLHKYEDYLNRYASIHVNDPSAVEDLVQETYLAALKSKNSFRGLSSERTWLTSILRHKIFDFYHEKKNNAERNVDYSPAVEHLVKKQGSGLDGHPEWGSTPESVFNEKDTFRKINDCMNCMSENCRKAFQFYELDGLPSDEVCRLLDISPANLRVTLFRTRSKLRKCLTDKCVVN